MEKVVLPKFVSWVNSILVLPQNSMLFNKELYFNAIIQNKTLKITNTPEYKKRK